MVIGPIYKVRVIQEAEEERGEKVIASQLFDIIDLNGKVI